MSGGHSTNSIINRKLSARLHKHVVMRSFSLYQYKKMSERFNKMSFREKIVTIQKNSDILTLASDYNWWGVKVKDKEIQEQLEDEGCQFDIEKEWDSSEMNELVDLLGIGNVDI